MRTTITVSVVVALLALLVITKGTTETTKGPIQDAMSIYNLHVGYLKMKDLPEQEAPLP
jgi:hypothetical protein